MRVLMLGWEFPPFITGGLGTACYGLTRALDRAGTHVTFMLPGETDPSAVSHLQLVSPRTATVPADAPPSSQADAAVAAPPPPTPTSHTEFSEHVQFVHVPSRLTHPYPGEGPVGTIGISSTTSRTVTTTEGAVDAPDDDSQIHDDHDDDQPMAQEYAGDMMAEVRRFAAFVEKASRSLEFDVIHAHDWMTYPAGLAVARRTGKPLVVHVHSTEFDRSGEAVNQQIYDIERRGMHGAMRVVTVSRLTGNIAVRRYGVNPDRVTVVYNGVAIDPVEAGVRPIGRREKIVLYFGRITRQKGPEFFIRAAQRVLQVEKNVRFVIAGSGDLYQRCIELAAELGIGQHFLFTGFLRGTDIDRVFSMAELFVMPSVSEPFGIAPLEAMSHDVPVLISKSSGASEVLTHALKVDFWDTEAMADKILAVLRHPPLGQTLRRHGVIDVRRLTWDDAAAKCNRVYGEVIEALSPARPAPS